jgi:hypothetical protein
MKYVVFNTPKGPTALCFTVPHTHQEIAELVKPAMWEPVSAGFYQVLPDGPGLMSYTFGRSESLNLSPAPGDAKLLTKLSQLTDAIAPR